MSATISSENERGRMALIHWPKWQIKSFWLGLILRKKLLDELYIWGCIRKSPLGSNPLPSSTQIKYFKLPAQVWLKWIENVSCFFLKARSGPMVSVWGEPAATSTFLPPLLLSDFALPLLGWFMFSSVCGGVGPFMGHALGWRSMPDLVAMATEFV